VNAPWTYFFSPGRAGPQRRLVESRDRGGGDQGADQPRRVRDQARGLPQAGVDEPRPTRRRRPGRRSGTAPARPGRAGRPTGRPPSLTGGADRQRRVRHPGRTGRDVDPPAGAPRLVQVVLVSPGRLRLGNVFLLVGPGDAQVSGIRQVSTARAVPLREVAGDPRPASPSASQRPATRAASPAFRFRSARSAARRSFRAGGRRPGRSSLPGGIEEFPEFRDAARRAASSCSRNWTTSPSSAAIRSPRPAICSSCAAICPACASSRAACSRISASRGSSGGSESVTPRDHPRNRPRRRHGTPPAAQP